MLIYNNWGWDKQTTKRNKVHPDVRLTAPRNKGRKAAFTCLLVVVHAYCWLIRRGTSQPSKKKVLMSVVIRIYCLPGISLQWIRSLSLSCLLPPLSFHSAHVPNSHEIEITEEFTEVGLSSRRLSVLSNRHADFFFFLVEEG